MDTTPHADSGSQFDKIDKVSFLVFCSLFSGLSQWELKSIAQLMRLVEYRKGEVVYKEKEEASAFYVVVSGRFEAHASPDSENKKKVLGYLRRGDYFGEMSLLTNQAHSAAVLALSDSVVLELKKDDFKKIVEHNATVALELSRRLSSRVKGVDSRSRSLLRSDVIAAFGNQPKTGRTEFSINLAASLFQETRQKTILLDMSPSGSEIATRLHIAKKVPLAQFSNIENAPQDVLANFLVKHPVGFEVLSVGHSSEENGKAVISLLNHLAIEYRFIVIDLPVDMDETVFKALSQADFIYCVTDGRINNITEIKETLSDIEKELAFPPEKIAVVINEVIFGVRTTAKTKKELFGDKICYSLPATPEIKEHEFQSALPFVVDEPEAEYSRVVRHIARRVSNNLVGIALGSGAALGLAHIGVLKVLEREKIPVDIIAGSSIGALIGALYAMGKNAEEVEKIALEISSPWKLMQFMDFNIFPARGLFHGDFVMKHFKKHLGERTFDDCKIPLKITGANLSTRQTDVFDSGFVSDAVRTSIAIPAIFKPVFMKGELVVDGGILNPLPIRALHQAGANKVIAINVFPTSKDMLEKHILAQEAAEKIEQSFRKRNFLSRGFFIFRRWLGRRFSPNVFDILMNTIQSMEAEIAEVEGISADLLLRPVVPTASWVEFFKPRQFIKRGEEEAERLLPKIKALVSQQIV